jgi:hypothetical protein
MTVTVPTVGQGAPAGASQEGTGDGGNPAWGELLGVIPQELHSQVVPHLQKWDQGVQKRFTEVQSKYQPFEQFVSNGVEPSQLETALQVMEAIEQNPQAVYESLGQQFGFGQQLPAGQGQGQADPSEEMWEGVSPQFREQFESLKNEHETLRGVAGTMAQMMLQNQETSQQAQEDAELDQLYDGLMQDPEFAQLNQNGEAEPYINSLLMAGMEPQQAMEQFKLFVGHVMKTSARPAAPRVMGSGGMIPGQGVDPRKLSPQDRRALVANMIEQANANE